MRISFISHNIRVILLLSFAWSFLSPVKTSAQTESNSKSNVELLQADDLGITVRFTLGQYQISKVELEGQQYDRIELADAGRIDESGKPNLPLIAKMLGIPADAELKLTVISQQGADLTGNYLIEPAGSYAASGEDLSPGILRYNMDEASYSNPDEFPGKLAELGDIAWLREQRVVPLRFYPFQYRAGNRNLTVYSSITVRIDFIYPYGLIRPNQFPHSVDMKSSAFESIYQESLLNYNQAKYFRTGGAATTTLKPMASNSTQTNSNPRYKITITEDGIYRITYETLQSIGFPVDTINPQTFSMTNQGRPVAIYVSNNEGGDPTKFEPGEFILFYGEHFDGTYLASLYANEANQWRKNFIHPAGIMINWSPQFNHTMMEKYTNENVYWLSYDGNGGPFMNTQDATPQGGQIPTFFREKIHYENNLIWRTNHFTSEDTFFWDRVRTTSEITRTYTITIPNPVFDNNAILKSELIGYTESPFNNQDHHEIFYFNKSIYSSPIGDEYWDGLIKKDFSHAIPENALSNGINEIKIKFIKQSGVSLEDILVNWFEVEYDRQFIAQNNQLIFGVDNEGDYQYQISGFTSSSPWILNITDPLTPTLLTKSSFNNGTVTFEIYHTNNTKFIAANEHDISSQNIIPYQPPTDLNKPAEYLIITHKDFINAAQQLADYRSAHDGFTTKVIDIEDLYNEYNFGIYHPIAIKNYLKYSYVDWDEPPKYVLLIGDGSWNFLNSPNYDNVPIYMPPNLAWVDPWQGEVDSSNLLVTVNGDDPLPDILIGRLPVTSEDQVYDYLNKIRNHENQLNENWQKHYVFIADQPDPNAGDFPYLTSKIIQDFLSPIQQPKWFYLNEIKDENGNTHKVYTTDQNSNIDCTNYPDDNNPERFCWNATTDIIHLLNTDGAGLLNYSGHGAINIWTHYVKLIENQDIPQFNNSSHLPIILSWTCLDGYWIYPKTSTDYSSKTGQSLIEELIRNGANGIVAAFSPTGLGIATGHDYLERGFYNYIFSKQTPWRMGNAALAAKLYLYLNEPKSGDNLPRDVDLMHTYTIFGDPALLSSPPQFDSYLPLLLKH